MDKTANDYLVNHFLASDLVREVEFEVVSFFAIDGKQIFSVDRFLEIDSLNVLRFRSAHESQRYLSSYLTTNNHVFIAPTPMNSKENNIYFYKLAVPIDFDLVISCGLGVIRMLTGKYKGEYLFYSVNQIYNDNPLMMSNLITEWILIKFYIQMVCANEYIDRSLAKEWEENRLELLKFFPGNKDEIEQRLTKIFEDHVN